MREIKFRGKAKDTGEWMYGGIVHQTDCYGDPVDKWLIVDGTQTLDYNIGPSGEVIPETVGQYTGLNDKNGKEIYEGDIVITDECGWVGHVVYGTDMYYVEDGVGGFASYCNWKAYEIIGNIHEGVTE